MTNQKTPERQARQLLLSAAQGSEERDQAECHSGHGEHSGNDREDGIHGDMVTRGALPPCETSSASVVVAVSSSPLTDHSDESQCAENEPDRGEGESQDLGGGCHAATVTGDRENLLAEAREAFDAAGHMPQGTMDHEAQWLPFARLYNVAERMIDALAVTVGAPAVLSWDALHDELYSLIPLNVQGERAFELSSEMVQVIKAHCTRVAATRRTIPRHPRSELESRAVDMIGHLDQHGFTGADFGEVSDLIDQMLLALAAPVEVDEAKLAEVIRFEMSRGSYQMTPNEKPYATSSALVAHAVAEWLRGEGR